MSEWKEYKLDDVVSKLGDGLHGTPEYEPNGEYYFINGSNLKNGKIIVNESTKRVAAKEFIKYKKELSSRTILVSINGTLGNIATYTGEKVVLGKSACYFNVKDDFNRDFVKYVVLNADFQRYIHEYATGTTIKNVPLKAIREYVFNAPDLQTQQSIAEILSSLDDKIELNNQINANLEALAQAIFKQWFIDFEFPDKNGNPYKSSGGKMVESDRALIPEGWKTGSIRDLVNFGNETINVDNLTLENYISTENMVQDYGGITIASSLPSTKTVKAFSKNNLLVSNIRPYFKKIFFPPFAGGCSADVIVFVPNSSIYSDYAYQAMRNDAFFAYVMTGARGTKMPRGDKSHIIKFPITIPSNSVLELFSDISRSLTLKIQENTRENQGLESLRDALIPQLITGQIQVQL